MNTDPRPLPRYRLTHIPLDPIAANERRHREWKALQIELAALEREAELTEDNESITHIYREIRRIETRCADMFHEPLPETIEKYEKILPGEPGYEEAEFEEKHVFFPRHYQGDFQWQNIPNAPPP